MSNTSKYVIFGSMAAAGIVAIAAILDFVTDIKPFAGEKLMDTVFLIGAGIVIYLGWDAYQDLK